MNQTANPSMVSYTLEISISGDRLEPSTEWEVVVICGPVLVVNLRQRINNATCDQKNISGTINSLSSFPLFAGKFLMRFGLRYCWCPGTLLASGCISQRGSRW